MTDAPALRRAFADVTDGQIHYRYGGEGSARPIVLIHASPGSSQALAPLARALARDRRVIAPDTMGNGDSSGLLPADPDISFFAARAMEALDAIGLDSFDIYGTHTGAAIAAEIAIAHPDRVAHLILDGVGMYSEDLQAELLERYAPAMQPDLHGSHFNWAWHFIRDTCLFWPWYRTDAAHRRPLGLPPADILHNKVLDVLKAIGTYHLPYRAAFRYDKRARFPMIAVPTLAACAAEDMLSRWHDEYAGLIPRAEKAVTPLVTADPEGAAAAFRAFLDR